MRVLITDGATNKSLAVVRSVGECADFVGVSSAFPVSVAGVSRHADASYWLREREPAAYVAELDRIAGRADVDQLLPVGGRTFHVVSEHREELSLPVGSILPDRAAMNAAIDKRETAALADRVGVPVPTTRSLSADDDPAAVGREVGYPAVVKSGLETETRFVEVVDSAAELRDALETYRSVNDSDPLVQEYLPGTARGYFAFYVEGDIVDGYAHRRIREYPPEGGASACAASKRDPELREYATALLDELDWHGVAMVEFKESADGVPKLVELNPKFWGSLDLAIESGLDFPRALLEYTDGAESFDFEFTPRCVNWPLSGDLTHAWRRPRSAPDVFEDLLSPHVRSNFRRDDPAPHAVEAAVTLLRRDV
jgi:predicted ATP-grasp superfamily ATP-dependent carboligase